DGGSLDRHLGGAPWPAQVAAPFVEVLARAVHYAHERGVLHRDLKPSNILLQPRAESAEPGIPVPKITDFGLAKLVDGQPQQTLPTECLGTPSYMAPEQVPGKHGVIGPAVDIY